MRYAAYWPDGALWVDCVEDGVFITFSSEPDSTSPEYPAD